MKGVKGSGTPRVKKYDHAGRPKEEESKAFFCRLKIGDYEKLKSLGGREWLLKKIADEKA